MTTRPARSLSFALVLGIGTLASAPAWASSEEELCSAIGDLSQGWTLVAGAIDDANADNAIDAKESDEILATERKLEQPTRELVKLIRSNTRDRKLRRIADDLSSDMRRLGRPDDKSTWSDHAARLRGIAKTLKTLIGAC